MNCYSFMRTKQLRVSDPIQIKNRMKEFLGKKINIVLKDQTVMFGVLKEQSSSDITLLNMRLKNMRYRLSEIVEVYLDTVV